jgi:ribosome-associated toxin RatA of RatAB toxin-antitoxin module
MREVKRSALLAVSPGRLFALISDIESYPQFVPWCTHAKVTSRAEREMVATLGIRRGPLKGELTTRNELEPNRRILIHLLSGPLLKVLEGEWLLTPITDQGCRAELSMRFAFRNPFSGFIFEQVFAETASQLVDAFVHRAHAAA